MRRLFGTDGVRGIANDFLSCERAMQIGRAVATVLSGNRRYHPLVLIGTDTRISSSMLASACAAGLCSVGADVMLLGVIPTPAVAYLVEKYKARAGIVISASHNPYEYNGIKIFSEDGFKLPDAVEEMMESIVLDDSPAPVLAASDAIGQITHAENAVEDYITHIRATVHYSFDGLRVAVDCSNGAASVCAERLLTSLGAECHMLSDKPDGININRDCGSTHMENLRKYVLENGLDAGLAFDGDADRFLCVDEKGNEIDGDCIMAILSADMKRRGKLTGNTLVGTIMSNFGLTKFCEANDIRFVAEKVGDRYVLERMRQDGYCFGGEQSGHVIFRDFATTGDGELTAVQLLSLMAGSGKPLSELAAVMTKYPQHMVNIRVSPEAKVAFYTDPDVKAILGDATERIGGDGRVVVRPSGTEPLLRVMAEGKDEDFVRSLTEETAERIKTVLEKY